MDAVRFSGGLGGFRNDGISAFLSAGLDEIFSDGADGKRLGSRLGVHAISPHVTVDRRRIVRDFNVR
jgi:hypothetical protein